MMNRAEANQRCALNRFTLRQSGLNYTIHPMEGNKSIKDYTSDDLEDVTLMAGKLRHRK